MYAETAVRTHASPPPTAETARCHPRPEPVASTTLIGGRAAEGAAAVYQIAGVNVYRIDGVKDLSAGTPFSASGPGRTVKLAAVSAKSAEAAAGEQTATAALASAHGATAAK